MREGWFGERYLIIFDEEESIKATSEYNLNMLPPGYRIEGLLSWDDFILSHKGRFYTCPTVPLAEEHIKPLPLKKLPKNLKRDPRYEGQIKWYVKPLAFGGDPELEENVYWISHGEHRDLVKLWNTMLVNFKKE